MACKRSRVRSPSGPQCYSLLLQLADSVVSGLDLKEGEAVKAGEKLGHVALEKIPPYYAFDVTYAKMSIFPKKVDNWMSPYAALDSVFNHMTDGVLAQYNIFSASKAEDFAIPKATRYAKPCQYGEDGRQFSRERDQDWYNDWVGDINNAVD